MSLGALAGTRVVEVDGLGSAPFCAMLLADMGADVVRVVRPAAEAAALARGKRSVALDLKTDKGLGCLLELLDAADVLVEGFRPGVAERLGFGPDVVSERNPAVVYTRCTGWGQSGPLSARAGHDINYIAASGVLALIGRPDQPPTPPLNLVGDFGGGGLVAAFGTVCALLERSRSGQGQVIDAAMVDGSSLLATMFHELMALGIHDETRRGHNTLDGGAPYYDAYETADHRWVAVGAVEARFYAELISGLGLSTAELPDRADRAQWPRLRAAIGAAFLTRTRADWEAVFAGFDACVTPVLSPSECYRDPRHTARRAFVEVGDVYQPAPAPRLSRTPGRVAHAGSAPPEDVSEVLRAWRSR